MKTPLALLLAASAFAAAPVLTAADAAPAVDLDALKVPYHRFELANGLTVLVHEDHAVPIVGVNLWYHVGSKNELPGATGFAHLFEHFFFNGSEHYPHGFREAMDDLGVNNRNGTTNNDRTNFFEDVPVSALERTLYLEADRMGFLAGNLSREMLEREIGVVSNEKRQGENQPYGRVFDRASARLYPASHPYSWSTIGSLEDLEAATLEDVESWYETYYGPGNCVLSLAGDITLERAKELVEKYFGGIEPGPALARTESWVPVLEQDIRETMEDQVPQARIYRLWHAPPWGDPELARLQLVTEVLSGSRSGRLDRRLVYEREVATEVAAAVFDGEIASGVLVVVTVKPGVPVAIAEHELDQLLEEFLATTPEPAELARGRARIESRFARGIERLGGFGGRSDVLAESQTYGGDPHAYLATFETIRAATPQQVAASAQRWLGAHSYTMTVVPAPARAAAPSGLDRTVLPPLAPAADPEFPAIQSARLASGLEVRLVERHSAPLVNLTLAVDAGSASDAAEQAGLASLALELLDDGTATRDTFEIQDALDALGASISTATTLDSSLVRLRALSGTFAEALSIYADVVRNPSFPGELVALEKRRRLAAIAQEQAQPVGVALRLAPPLLYGAGHPYAKPLSGTGDAAAVEALSREDLAAWHRRWFQPGSATLVVAGDVTMAELLPALEASLGGWPSGQAPAKSVAAPGVGAAGRVFLVDRPDAPQSVIIAAHLSVPGGDPEDLAIETLLRNFGGMSTSRLNRNLRLDKHWSYGTAGFLVGAKGVRPLVVVAPVQTDKTKEAIVEVRREIEGLAGKRPVVGEELESILRNVTLRLPGRFETLSALESAVLDQVTYGYPADWWPTYGARARALGAEDLAAAATKVVHPEQLAWIIVGDLAKVEAGIRELELGAITHLDASGAVVER